MPQTNNILSSIASVAVPGAGGLAMNLVTGSAAWAFAVVVACALPTCAIQMRLAFRDLLHYRIATKPTAKAATNRAAARKFRELSDEPP